MFPKPVSIYCVLWQIPKPGGIRKGWMRQFVLICDFKLLLYDIVQERPQPISNVVNQVIDMRWQLSVIRACRLNIQDCTDDIIDPFCLFVCVGMPNLVLLECLKVRSYTPLKRTSRAYSRWDLPIWYIGLQCDWQVCAIIAIGIAGKMFQYYGGYFVTCSSVIKLHL